MIIVKALENLDYDALIDHLAELTKQYTSELAGDPHRVIDNEKVYLINLIIKEIEIREKRLLNKLIPSM